MAKKRKNEIYEKLYKLTTMEVYDYVINDIIPRFPAGFVTKENMRILIREVILNKEKLTREEICKNMSFKYLKQFRLAGSNKVFDTNIFKLVSYCFPELKIKYWELNKVEDGFWMQEKNRKEYMQWLIKKENIDPYKICDLRKITAALIDKNHGRRAREYGVYNLILLVAKVEIKEWQVVNVSRWTAEKAIVAIKWLIEEKLKWSAEETASMLTSKQFFDYGLGGLYSNFFKHSIIKALNLAYPKKFKKIGNSKIVVCS